jgi:predicted exporter
MLYTRADKHTAAWLAAAVAATVAAASRFSAVLSKLCPSSTSRLCHGVLAANSRTRAVKRGCLMSSMRDERRVVHTRSCKPVRTLPANAMAYACKLDVQVSSNTRVASLLTVQKH